MSKRARERLEQQALPWGKPKPLVEVLAEEPKPKPLVEVLAEDDGFLHASMCGPDGHSYYVIATGNLPEKPFIVRRFMHQLNAERWRNDHVDEANADGWLLIIRSSEWMIMQSQSGRDELLRMRDEFHAWVDAKVRKPPSVLDTLLAYKEKYEQEFNQRPRW